MTEQFVVLDEDQLERLAELVAVKFRALPSQEEQLVDVGTVARYLGVDPAWVYAHADEPGARRLGSGARPRLRFSLREVSAKLAQRPPVTEPKLRAKAPRPRPRTRQKRQSRTESDVDLLPIRDRRSAA
jgi:hypothetical protein